MYYVVGFFRCLHQFKGSQILYRQPLNYSITFCSYNFAIGRLLSCLSAALNSLPSSSFSPVNQARSIIFSKSTTLILIAYFLPFLKALFRITGILQHLSNTTYQFRLSVCAFQIQFGDFKVFRFSLFCMRQLCRFGFKTAKNDGFCFEFCRSHTECDGPWRTEFSSSENVSCPYCWIFFLPYFSRSKCTAAVNPHTVLSLQSANSLLLISNEGRIFHAQNGAIKLVADFGASIQVWNLSLLCCMLLF